MDHLANSTKTAQSIALDTIFNPIWTISYQRLSYYSMKNETEKKRQVSIKLGKMACLYE